MCCLSGKPLNGEEKEKNGDKQKYFEDGRQVRAPPLCCRLQWHKAKGAA
jgi:hypothetical protein